MSQLRTLALLGLVSLSPLAADPAPTSTSSSTSTNAPPVLPPVLVTAPTRVEEPVEQTASTTSVVSEHDIEVQHYATVADALSSVPGISLAPSGQPGQLTYLFGHGMDTRQNLLTIDDRRQTPGFDGAIDSLAYLSLDNLQQIEVVRTPVSDVNGGGAMGTVINLATLSGKGLDHPESSVSFEAGSFETTRENIQSRGAAGNFDYAVSVSRQDSQYPDVNTTFSNLNDPYRNTGYRGNFGYQITPEVYVDLHTAYSDFYTGSPGGFNVSPDPTANLLYENWDISPGVTAHVTDFYTTKLYYTRNQQRQNSQDPYSVALFAPFSNGLETRTQINTDSVDWQNDFQVAKDWKLTAGVQSDNTHYSIFDDYVGATTLDGNEDNIGGYLSSQWQPVEGLNVLNSVRYDAYSKFLGAFSWRQGAAYTIAPTKTVVHASVSEAYTPPSLDDLYYPGFSNPNLQPEKDLGWEIGAEQPLWNDRLTPSVTYYHNHITNYIQAPPPSYLPVNIAEATTEGVELGLKAHPLDNLNVSFNYSILRQVNDSNGGTDLAYRPRHLLNFTADYTPIPAVTVALGGNWTLNRSDADPIAADGSPVPDYFLLRASVTYRVNPNVSLWVRGENLTGESYQPVPGYYGTSTGGYGGVKVSF